MGNILISTSAESNTVNLSDKNTFSESEIMNESSSVHEREENMDEQFHDTIEDSSYEEARNKRKEDELNEFKKQLNVKREQRRNILARHRAEKKSLEETLIAERKSKLELINQNRLLKDLLQKNNVELSLDCKSSTEYEEFLQIINQMREEMESLKSNNKGLRLDLASSNKALQEANSDIAELSAQHTESMKHINALKEVVTVSKTMINLRENQLIELKNKLNEIEQSLADREASMLSTDLRQEYERQLQNIRTLRGLYEERARLAEVTKQALIRELDENKLLLQAEIKKTEELNTKVEELEHKVNKLEDAIDDKNDVISSCQEECRGLQSEMSVVNKLFSQVLLGYKSKKDLDKLVTRLEENHGLLTHMVEKENGSEGSSELPKLLLELVSQIEEKDTNNTENVEEIDIDHDNHAEIIKSGVGSLSSAEEIVQNLPKVWRVLMELLSHQSKADSNSSPKVTTCYKSVQTKSGTVLVPSVSQTYIRLKDLILEKLALIKEVNHMKQLNTHLESRLQDQEKRLCSVTNELGKTWHVVGRLRRHHQQLHTHEKILKYELQQKRKMLNELKEELEYCREKWEQAREKNMQSEEDWKKLRTEFSNRKKMDSNSLNNSAESGYSDEKPSDESSASSDESCYEIESKLKYKKKIKKSFETVFDSSADINLSAERDDPESDMLDVADLSLDPHDDTIEVLIQEDLFHNDHDEHIHNDKAVETEDECADISQDASITDASISTQPESDYKNIDSLKSCVSIDNNEGCTSGHAGHNFSCRLENVQTQNDVIESTDNNLDTQDTEDINLLEESQLEETSAILLNINQEDLNRNENIIVSTCSTGTQQVIEVDFKTILENVKRQDENLRRKEKRLQNLEESCSNVVSNLNSTINAGDSIISKLNKLHPENNKEENVINIETGSTIVESQEEAEPSTSSEIDHEARFAARDIRLKRLEEQTKCLVNRVNKTTTKGVKIHYKIEELQNIYGADTSRSGTPSEDTEDTSQNTDDGSQEDDI